VAVSVDETGQERYTREMLKRWRGRAGLNTLIVPSVDEDDASIIGYGDKHIRLEPLWRVDVVGSKM
jgi:hypothetical protein